MKIIKDGKEQVLEQLEKSNNQFSDYNISELDTGSPQYFGYEKDNGAWYIQRLSDTEARYAAGTSDLTTNWTNRASLSYNTIKNTF